MITRADGSTKHFVWRVKIKQKAKIARQALDRYGKLYRIEHEIKHLSPDERKTARQTRAVPLWSAFIDWATPLYTQGVARRNTRANGDNPYHYLSVLLTELPAAKTVEHVEALLPWEISPEKVSDKFATYPTP